MSRRSSTLPILLALASLAVSLLSPGAARGDDPASLWKGAWVLTRVESYSGCGPFHTNNRVEGNRVTSKGDRRFAAGELAKVDKVDVKRRRVDLLLTLEQPILRPVQDGPFTLYDELVCKVELRVELPDRRSASTVAAAVEATLERFDSPDEARSSPDWNGRVREPYPPDYEETLAAHATWKAQQANAEVGRRLDESLEAAARIARDVDDDADYLGGFAAGIDKARDAYFGNCPSLLDSSPYGFTRSAPKDHSRRWKDGYRDGQLLIYHLEMARRLRGCFVPVPPPPPPARGRG